MSPKGNQHEVVTRVFRAPGEQCYNEMRDYGAVERIVRLIASDALALRFDELEIE
jgi:hypothetical protein